MRVAGQQHRAASRLSRITLEQSGLVNWPWIQAHLGDRVSMSWPRKLMDFLRMTYAESCAFGYL